MAILKTLLAQKKILTISYPPSMMQSRYVTFWDTASICQNIHSELSIKSNVQKSHSNFNQLYHIVSKLSSMGFYVGIKCSQEAWLASAGDLSLLQSPGYNIILQGTNYAQHDVLTIHFCEMH